MSDFLPIYDVTPFTMLDFPGHIACIVWFSGCNMRCQYCHNPEIVKGKAGKLKADEVLSFLRSRQGLLEGVVLSGGEATLYPGLLPFARALREMRYLVKLDTNGTRPGIVRQMLDEGLLARVALDYKAPPEKFKTVTGISEWAAFEETLDMLISAGSLPVEIRTTVHSGLLDEQDVAAIIADLETRGWRGKYYIQNYRHPKGHTLGNLSPQQQPIEISRIISQSPFPVILRNFDA